MKVQTRYQLSSIFVILFFLFLIVVSAGSSYASSHSRKYVTNEQLEEALKSKNKDRILGLLNSSLSMRYQGDLLPFLTDLWEHRTDRYPNLPWETIESPIVKIAIADILLQARRNRLWDIDAAPMQAYLRSATKSRDVQVKLRAILTLGVIADKSDISLFVAVSKSQIPGIFHASVLSLSKVCGNEAKTALIRMEKSETNERRKKYIKETRHEMARFFKKTRGAWCSN